MDKWLVRKGDPTRDVVSLAREREVLEYEIDGRPFVFSCELVPNERTGKGLAVMMHLAEADGAPCGGRPLEADDLAVAFDDGVLPPELDLATIVTCRSRTEWLFASVADLVEASAS